MICDECGTERKALTRVNHADGELVEWGSGKASSATRPTLAAQREFYGELKWIAEDRGYRGGWIAHKFKEKFGAGPNDFRVKSAAPARASLKTTNWIRSRAIAYARARGNAVA